MAVDVGIWLFNISKCGYYHFRHAKNSGHAVFGNVTETLASLAAWTSGRTLSETSTFDVPADSDLTKVYLLGLHPASNGDYLVALWNRLQTSSNQIASVGMHDVVGNVTTEFTEIDENRIPGYATYFWVMPNENAIASVRVKHMTNGLRNCQQYLSRFLRDINPQHVVLGNAGPDGEINIDGYRSDLQSPNVLSLRARFDITSIPKPGEATYIIQNAPLVEKVICKTTLTNQVAVERQWWQSGLDLFNMGSSRVMTDEVPIKLEMPVTFTESELAQTIDSWKERLETTESWDDIGFVMRGQKTPHWLGKSYARKNFPFDLQWIDEELVEPQSLLAQLQAHRAAILAMGK